ncbi:helix-turn-helix domain-containing protein [Paenibacillus sp. DXFW5]|uniref:Helix-turn-helix domain-containing protein n=1 Tax=Paenibacillus rhizolycopersici TaxID=2780073 RepID=A0ABS2H2M2_9BACL|nr:helix-turn-helix domain-containing protein [Paenibacillus rhizolycopersici]MBM6995702.1 helix-turn-helix domain-containing protein [Paenibacillus rhizolycopersici]
MKIKPFLQKTYFRTFLLLTTVLICSMIPFVYFLSAEFSKYTMLEVRSNSQNEVNNLASKADMILGNLKAYGLSMYADQNIQNWFFNTSQDPLIDHAALVAQSNFMSTEPLIQRSYLMNVKHGLVVDSKAGIVRNDSFADQDMLERVKSFQSQYLRFFSHSLDGSNCLALVLPATPEKPSDFYLVLLIDKPLLNKLIFGETVTSEQDIRILDENGFVLLGTSNSAALNEQLFQAKQDHQDNSFQVRLPNQRWYVNTAKLTTEDWSVYYSTEYHILTRHIALFQQKLIAYTLLLLGIVSSLFFWSSHRSLRSITFLSEKLKKKVAFANPASDAKADIQWINDGIDLLLNNVEQLHASMRNQSELVRTEFLAQWVLHGSPGTRSYEYIRSRTKLTSCEVLFMAVLRIEAYKAFCERYDFPSRKLIKYAIRNISEEVICNGPYAAEGLDMGGDHLILIIGGHERGEFHLQRLLEETQHQVARILSIDTTVAVSNAYDFGANFRNVYDHIYELTMLRFLNGERQIFLESDYEEFMAGYPSATEALETNEIIKSIRCGRPETAVAMLHRQMKHIHELPYRDCKLYLTYFTYDLLKNFNKFSVLHEISSIHQLLERFSTLSEYQAWLESIVTMLASETIAPKSSSRKEEIVLEIKEYVDNHLQDTQLSIEQVADNFSFSVSYIRQLFKEINNVSLSEYILQERIERVKEKLVSSQLSVLEIADQCGFISKGHFFAVFKKFTNLTPKQFREIHGDVEARSSW